MRADPGKPYYSAYEKRYRAVYEQDVPYWTAFPEELASVKAEIDRFLAEAEIAPGAEILELGCGEGYVGTLLAERGYAYTGVDVAESAVKKASERLLPFGGSARAGVADVLHLDMFADASFDAAVDIACLHMLVVDNDRRLYLREAFRVLKPGAPILFARESLDEKAFDGIVESYEQWLEVSGTDVDTPEERSAWRDGEEAKIRIPRIAARARSAAQYVAELRGAGFERVKRRADAKSATASLTARKPK